MKNLSTQIALPICQKHKKHRRPQSIQALCIDTKCFSNRNLCIDCLQDHQNHQMIDFHHLTMLLKQEDFNYITQEQQVQNRFNNLKQLILQQLESTEIKLKILFSEIRQQYSPSTFWEQLLSSKEKVTQNQLQQLGEQLSGLLTEKKNGEIEYFEVQQLSWEDTNQFAQIHELQSRLTYTAQYLTQFDNLNCNQDFHPLNCYQYFPHIKASESISKGISKFTFEQQENLIQIELNKSHNLSKQLLESINTLNQIHHKDLQLINELQESLQEYILVNFEISYSEPILLQKHTDQIQSITISEDGSFIASADQTGIIFVWELKSLLQSRQLTLENQVYDLQFSKNNKFLAAAHFKNPFEIVLFDMNDKEKNTPSIRLKGHQNTIWRIQFTKDLQSMISGSSDQYLMIWNLEKETYNLYFKLSNIVCGVSISSNQAYISACCRDGKAYLFECIQTIYKTKQVADWQAHDDKAFCTVFTPDSEQLVTSFKEIKIWKITELLSKEKVKIPERVIGNGNMYGIWDLHILIKGQLIISNDKRVNIWNMKSGKQVIVLDLPSGYQYEEDKQVGVTSDMKFLVVGGKDNMVQVYQISFL